MYAELQPSSRTSLIDTIWTYRDNPTHERFNVIPDACTDLIFDLRAGLAFISGVMSHFQMRSLTRESFLIGFRLKAEKFGPLTSIPASKTTDARIPARDIIAQFDRHFMQRLLDRNDIEAQARLIEKTLMEINQAQAPMRDLLIDSVALDIRARRDKVDLVKLATDHHLSLRQLERRFKRQIGLSPKAFASIIRLGQAMGEIQRQPVKKLYDVAYSCGFYDQSHMANEFKRLTGEQPGNFRAYRA